MIECSGVRQGKVTIIIRVEIADDDTVVPKVVVALDPTPDLEIEGKETTESEVELKRMTGKEMQRMVGE